VIRIPLYKRFFDSLLRSNHYCEPSSKLHFFGWHLQSQLLHIDYSKRQQINADVVVGFSTCFMAV